MTTRMTNPEITEAMADFALMLGMERAIPPTGAFGHKLLEMLESGDKALRELQETRAALAEVTRLRAAMEQAKDVLIQPIIMTNKRTVDDLGSALMRAQSIAGDAWRILDAVTVVRP